jgi:hypothetical protein
MSEPQKVHHYVSLDLPYDSVREGLCRLVGDTVGSRIHVRSAYHQDHAAGLPFATRVTLGCGSADGSADPPFVVSSAEIYASALSDAETRLEIEGHWAARPGVAACGRLESDAATYVREILEAVVSRLRTDLSPPARRRRPGAGRKAAVLSR